MGKDYKLNGMDTVKKAVADIYPALNNSLGGLEFAQNAKGNWNYKPASANTVNPHLGNSKVQYILTLYT